jgi:hypothetical protein
MTTPRGVFEARPTVVIPGRWSFWADMIRGDVPLGPVDVSGFGCTTRLSGFGNATGTFALPCGIDEARLLRLWSWRLWAYYDGELYWCGCPSGIADEDGSVRVTLTFTELPGYLHKRQFDEWPKWSTPQAPAAGMEQTEIARRLAGPVEDVGVRLVTEPGPAPILRYRTYEFLESDSRAALLSNLSGVLDGPEFRSEYDTTAAGRPRCTLRIAYPRVGSGEAGLGVTIPGAALGYTARWDADRMRTTTFAVGDLPENAPEGTPRPVARVDRPQDDLPRLDAADDWPGTFLQSTLNERAATMAAIQNSPALALSASPPESFPPITRYRVGDDVTVRATTPLLPGGLEVTGRLTEVSVSAGEGTATWTVSAPSPPPIARETVARRLDRLDTWTRQMFHTGGIANPGPPTEEVAQ